MATATRQTFKNPWAQRWAHGFSGFNSSEEQRGMEREARNAENTETHDCQKPNCGGICYYRPGVGGWWCDKCGNLDR